MTNWSLLIHELANCGKYEVSQATTNSERKLVSWIPRIIFFAGASREH